MAALRARSQLIHRPAGNAHPADVLRAIAGAQSQEPRAGRLQLRARSRTLTAEAVESARVDERSILRTWVMRGTAHLIATEDAGWLAPLFAERIASWSRRRLEQLGVAARERDRALAAIRKALASGPLTRSEAMALAAATGLEVDVQRRTHLSTLLVVEGVACIGPNAGRESVLVAARDWIGVQRPRDRDDALAELARRYVRAFAPVTERDFAAWAGLPLRDCRAGLAGIAAELDEIRMASGAALVPRGASLRAPRSPVVRLLPAYDTYLMGYDGRAHAVDPEGERRILPGGGVLRPTICVDGRFAGLWSSRKVGSRLSVSLDPFPGFDPAWRDAIEAEVADIGRFEGIGASIADAGA